MTVTLVGGVVVLGGAQAAVAITCPVAVAPTAIDHQYTVPFGAQLKVVPTATNRGLLDGATGTSIYVETSWQTSIDPNLPSDDTSALGEDIIKYGSGSPFTQNRLGGFTYTPDDTLDPFSGNDFFSYTVSNDCGDEAFGEVDITVVPKFVASTTYSTQMDTPLDVPVDSGFLAHDAGVDPSSLQYDFTSAQGGNVDDSFNSDGSFVYTPPPGFIGADSFAFSVTDINQDNTYDGVVHINVQGAATAPSAPTGVVATAGVKSARVSWAKPAANGSPITSYSVTASPGGNTVSALSSPVTLNGLTAGTKYTFKVRAKNAIGTGPLSAASNAVTVLNEPPSRAGYWMAAANGTVYGFGNAVALKSAASSAVAIAPRRDGRGYWTVDAAGNVSAFGAAAGHGGHPALRSGEVVSTISATPSGNGYWLFTNRGRAFAFGDAPFLGDMRAQVLNGPVIASVATPTGHGYYMVGSDGGVFSFGDARFHGSTGGIHLNKPVVGISPTADNRGYWLVASDGGVFAFNAPFRGSMGSTRLAKPVNGLVGYGNGYLMVAADGGVFTFSNKAFLGSLASDPPPAPVIGIAAFTTG
jgi:hypothetical protein